MRITESQLRRVIREVIEEVESSPASSDKVQQVEDLIRNFSNSCEVKLNNNEMIEREDLYKFVDDVIRVCCKDKMPQGSELQTRQMQVGDIISRYRNNGGIGSVMIVPEEEIESLANSICQKLQENSPQSQVGNYYFKN